MDNDLALLHQKIDYLTEQVEEQKRRQQEFDELKQDLIPLANHMVKLSIDELAEIGRDFQLEDLLFLLKRLLRNTHTMLDLLDRLESITGLADDANRIGKEAFAYTVETLDRLEREGYFDFLREGTYIVERIVDEFTVEDVRALGDNVVTILKTVRNMTQPEVLALANNAIITISTDDTQDDKAPSTLSLLRELSDPQVRKGMSRMLNVVKALADQPPANSHKN
ncbi:MAG: DUF1641 domain-containing protein [Anaerolineales bacterium]|nr:DUF1641 domain-containing protein [Anaerolineales bacterium]